MIITKLVKRVLCLSTWGFLCTYIAYIAVLHKKMEKVTTNSQRETTKVKNILVVAYMRSGSTFTSKILEHGSNTPAFFSMEPLWQIYRKCHRRKKGVCCPNNTCRGPLNQQEEIGFALSVLQSIYACNLTALPYEILMSFRVFPSTGSDYIKSANCFPHKTSKDKMKQDLCLQHLTHLCKASSVIIIKTLRVDIQLAMLLKSYLENLYIIHLVRDPRAIFSSRKELNGLTTDPLSVQSEHLCWTMQQNSMDVTRFTNNCFTLQYERLAKEPEKVVRSLYKFCELTFTSNTSRWLQQFTNPTMEEVKHHKAQSLIIPSPRNSSHVYQKWRQNVSWREAEIIQRSCDQLLGILGLHVFTGETELRNLSFDVIKN